MEILKNIAYVLLGIVLAIGIFCMVIGIASAVNDVSFGQQIVEWFGTTKEVVEPVEDVVETVKMLIVG